MLPRLNTEERLMTKEEFLYELEKETLNKLRPFLCNHLIPEKLFPYLQARNCLSLDDCEQIRSMITTNNKVNKLIDVIIKSGPEGLMTLIKAIKKSSRTQEFIAQKLERRYTDLKNKEYNKNKLAEIGRYTMAPPPPYTPPIEENQSILTSKTTVESWSGQVKQTPSSEISRPPLLRPMSRTPVTVEWPSVRQRTETASSCYTSHFMDCVSTFRSSDYPRETVDTPPPYVYEQEEKLSMYNQESSINQESYSDAYDVKKHDPGNMKKSPRTRNRYPDEHDSLMTEVKQLQVSDFPHTAAPSQGPDGASTARVEYPSNLPVSPGSVNSSYTVCRPPNDFLGDESFEVSGETFSTSLYASS